MPKDNWIKTYLDTHIIRNAAIGGLVFGILAAKIPPSMFSHMIWLFVGWHVVAVGARHAVYYGMKGKHRSMLTEWFNYVISFGLTQGLSILIFGLHPLAAHQAFQIFGTTLAGFCLIAGMVLPSVLIYAFLTVRHWFVVRRK